MLCFQVILGDLPKNTKKTRKERKGKERKGKERKGKAKQGKGREGKGREGKVRKEVEETQQTLSCLSTILAGRQAWPCYFSESCKNFGIFPAPAFSRQSIMGVAASVSTLDSASIQSPAPFENAHSNVGHLRS